MFRALTSRVGARTLAMRALPAQSGSRTATMATSREQFLEDYGSPDNAFEKDRVPKTGDDSQRAFAYMVLSGGRFVYASAARLAVLKVVSTMSASADVLALASLEVDLSAVDEGTTVTVKWRGKPVFVRHRTPAEIAGEEKVEVGSLRDQEADGDRCKKPEWMIVLGVCTHLGCVPISNAGEYHGWFCPCHGSHYDTAGRIRKGPAPLNLEVPPYKFLEENKLLLG